MMINCFDVTTAQVGAICVEPRRFVDYGKRIRTGEGRGRGGEGETENEDKKKKKKKKKGGGEAYVLGQAC